MADLQITWLHAINNRSVLLRLGEKLPWTETFARRAILDIGNILSNDLIVAERQARRILPDFLQLLPIVGFLGFHDEIANAKLFDERHHFLLGAGSDGEHGHHGGHAKNHSQHSEERTQLVAGEIFESENNIGKPLLQGSWLGDGTGFHRYARSLKWNLVPN